MQPDCIVIRHPETGAPKIAAENSHCSVINAGDGIGEHPTQALLDAFTIQRMKGDFKNLTIAICGDILHSRVAHSNMKLLSKLGAHVHVIAPKELLPSDIDLSKFSVSNTMKDGLKAQML